MSAYMEAMIVYHYPFTELKEDKNDIKYTKNKHRNIFWFFIILAANTVTGWRCLSRAVIHIFHIMIHIF